VHPGAIVVMHLRAQTAAALPAILSGLKARGYRAVSLPELFHAAGMR
jgi:peptidoglycan/xylan/chitin deacetylase (PgdA/CDA1 family)